jgi:hypothetical protein
MKFLYQIAKESYEVTCDKDSELLEQLKVICDMQCQQYKKILDLIQSEKPQHSLLVQYFKEGLNDSNDLKWKYERLNEYEATGSSTTSTSTTTVKPANVYEGGMLFVSKFRHEKMKISERMDWKQCVFEGRKKGFLLGYKNTDSHLSQFTNHQKSKSCK